MESRSPSSTPPVPTVRVAFVGECGPGVLNCVLGDFLLPPAHRLPPLTAYEVLPLEAGGSPRVVVQYYLKEQELFTETFGIELPVGAQSGAEGEGFGACRAPKPILRCDTLKKFALRVAHDIKQSGIGEGEEVDLSAVVTVHFNSPVCDAERKGEFRLVWCTESSMLTGHADLTFACGHCLGSPESNDVVVCREGRKDTLSPLGSMAARLTGKENGETMALDFFLTGALLPAVRSVLAERHPDSVLDWSFPESPQSPTLSASTGDWIDAGEDTELGVVSGTESCPGDCDSEEGDSGVWTIVDSDGEGEEDCVVEVCSSSNWSEATPCPSECPADEAASEDGEGKGTVEGAKEGPGIPRRPIPASCSRPAYIPASIRDPYVPSTKKYTPGDRPAYIPASATRKPVVLSAQNWEPRSARTPPNPLPQPTWSPSAANSDRLSWRPASRDWKPRPATARAE